MQNFIHEYQDFQSSHISALKNAYIQRGRIANPPELGLNGCFHACNKCPNAAEQAFQAMGQMFQDVGTPKRRYFSSVVSSSV